MDWRSDASRDVDIREIIKMQFSLPNILDSRRVSSVSPMRVGMEARKQSPRTLENNGGYISGVLSRIVCERYQTYSRWNDSK